MYNYVQDTECAESLQPNPSVSRSVFIIEDAKIQFYFIHKKRDSLHQNASIKNFNTE